MFRFRPALKKKAGAIGEIVMASHVIAGVGNIYRADALSPSRAFAKGAAFRSSACATVGHICDLANARSGRRCAWYDGPGRGPEPHRLRGEREALR